ncbi:MAG: carbohydrate-binding protein [Byssovorax sp.]
MSRYLTARRTGLALLVSVVAAAVGCLGEPSPDDESAASDESGISAAQCASAPSWATNTAYSTGSLARYQGKVYSCLQAHTSQVGWTPAAVPALWHEESCAGGGATSGVTVGATSGVTSGGGGGCTSTAWQQGAMYHTGDVVVFKGSSYVATHDNPGYDPTISTWFWSPTAACGGSGSGGGCNYPQWQQGASYHTGDTVLFKGSPYVATHDNPGYDPTISTWFWSPAGGCGGGSTSSSSTSGAGGASSSSSSAGSSTSGGGGNGGGNPLGKLFVGYYQTWSDGWKANGADTVLAKLPSYVNVVNISFAQPNMNYAAGSLSLGGTGVGVPYDGPTLKVAIAALHQKNPGTRVMLSVGGATFPSFSSFNAGGIAAFVKDFGLDGVDIDYEPANPACTNGGGTVSCPSDAEYVSVVKSMRAALPSPYWISIAAWSVGAYGEGAWANAPPSSAFAGISLAVLKQASSSLDLVNVMSYDASPAFDPVQALHAYQHYFTGRIAMGIEVPPEAWGGHIETVGEIDTLANAVNGSGAAGLMLWSIQKPGPAQQFATEICSKLGLASCNTPMF